MFFVYPKSSLILGVPCRPATPEPDLWKDDKVI